MLCSLLPSEVNSVKSTKLIVWITLILSIGITYAQIPQNYEVMMNLPTWNSHGWSLLYQNLNAVSEITIFHVYPQADGSITYDGNANNITSIISVAHQNNIKVCLAIGGSGSTSTANNNRVLNSPTLRAELVNNVASEVQKMGYDCIHWDFENTAPGDFSSANYTILIQQSRLLEPSSVSIDCTFSSWETIDVPGIAPYCNHLLDMFNPSRSELDHYAALIGGPSKLLAGYDLSPGDANYYVPTSSDLAGLKSAGYGFFFWSASQATQSTYDTIRTAIGSSSSSSTTTTTQTTTSSSSTFSTSFSSSSSTTATTVAVSAITTTISNCRIIGQNNGGSVQACNINGSTWINVGRSTDLASIKKYVNSTSDIATSNTVGGVNIPNQIIKYVPYTLINTQDIPTTNPYQEMITINSTNYSGWLNHNLSNVEWFYANGTIIKSWLESGQSNISNSSVYWLSIPQIKAHGELKIYEGFAQKNVNLIDGFNTGWAPNLVGQNYGEWDNGAQIFTRLYQNFVGTSTPLGWFNDGMTVNNGVIVPKSSQAEMISLLNYGLNASETLDLYASSMGPPNLIRSGTYAGYVTNYGEFINGAVSLDGYSVQCAFIGGLNMGWSCSPFSSKPNDTSYYVYSIYWAQQDMSNVSINYSNPITIKHQTSTTPISVGIVRAGGQYALSSQMDWIRIRSTPPNLVPLTVMHG